ncbi:MAG TPA: hypothetical protein PLN21_06720 [Gemmatales bacterium]|nr:hypothetical protein [Gemmatales bacterium]
MSRIIFSVVLVTLTCCFTHGQGPLEGEAKHVPVLVAWEGIIGLEQRKDSPDAQCITDQVAWKKLWELWRPKEQVPEVNFTDAIVLVGLTGTPNKVRIGAAIDTEGNLVAQIASTLIGGASKKTFHYQFGVISRIGIKSISQELRR